MRRIFTLPVTVTSLLLGAVILTACATTSDSETLADTSSTSITDVDATSTAEEVLAANENATTTNDDEWSTDGAVNISLATDTATSDGDGVTVDGNTVTITAAGTYLLSGTLAGQIVVDTSDDGVVALVLDGADISSETASAIAVVNATNAVVSLADGSENTLSDTSSYADDADANAALYADTDLTISGSGALTVTGNGNDGIASTDDLVILGGTITVDAVDDGLRGKDSLTVEDGAVTVTAGGDGLKSDNADELSRGYIDISGGTLDVTAAGDGLDAETDLVVTGGDITVESGGGAGATLADDVSAKGLKGGTYAIVEGGTIAVDAADDSAHSNGAIHIGGDAEVNLASGDDGVHADTALYIDGSTLNVSESNEGLESADITIADGVVDITASDDGINGSAGSTTSTEEGTAAEGTTPAQGEAPSGEMPTGDMPAQGEMPTDGEAPTGGGAPAGGMGGETGGTELVTISGGTVTIDAEGDGLDSNGSAVISGGTTTVYGPTNDGNGALDVNGTLTVSAGTLLAVGSSGMAVSPGTDSTQGFIAATASGEAGSAVEIRAADGTVVESFTSAKQFASVVYSSSELEDGAEYEVFVDGVSAGTATEGVAATGGMGGGR